MKYFDCMLIFGISLWGVALMANVLFKIFKRGLLGDMIICFCFFLIGGFIMHILIKIKERWL